MSAEAPLTVEAWLRRSASRSPKVRWRAIHLLSDDEEGGAAHLRDEPRVHARLLAALEDPREDGLVRLGVLHALNETIVPDAVPALGRILLDPGSHEIDRGAAVWALGTQGGPEAADALLACLAHPDMAEHHEFTLVNLARTGDERALAAVLPFAEHPDWRPRWGAARALELLGDLRALAVALSLVEDPAVPDEDRAYLPGWLAELRGRFQSGA